MSNGEVVSWGITVLSFFSQKGQDSDIFVTCKCLARKLKPKKQWETIQKRVKPGNFLRSFKLSRGNIFMQNCVQYTAFCRFFLKFCRSLLSFCIVKLEHKFAEQLVVFIVFAVYQTFLPLRILFEQCSPTFRQFVAFQKSIYIVFLWLFEPWFTGKTRSPY